MVWNALDSAEAPGDVIDVIEHNKRAENIEHLVDDVVESAHCTADLSLTTSYQDIAGNGPGSLLAVTLNKDGTWIVTVDFQFSIDSGDASQFMQGQLLIDGVAQTGIVTLQAAHSSGSDIRHGSRSWKVTGVTAGDVAKAQAKKAGGGGSSTIRSSGNGPAITARWCKPT